MERLPHIFIGLLKHTLGSIYFRQNAAGGHSAACMAIKDKKNPGERGMISRVITPYRFAD